MLIWKRLGFLAVLIPVGLAMLSQLSIGDYAVLAGLGYLLGGVAIWLMGRQWNTRPGDTWRDPLTGQVLLSAVKHWFFWIRMEYWGVLAVLLGALVIISELIPGGMHDDVFLLLFGLAILGLIGYSIFEYYKFKRRYGAPFICQPKHLQHASAKEIRPNKAATPANEQPAAPARPMTTLPRELVDSLKSEQPGPKPFTPSDPSRFMPKPTNSPEE